MFSWQGKRVQKCDSGEHLEGQGTVILKCCLELVAMCTGSN